MFHNVEIAFLGASSVDKKNGSALWEPAVPLTNADTDLQSFGPTPVYQSLGVTSLPYPKTAEGYAECLVVRHVGGRNAVCVGGRDTRTAKIVGKMDPGDTVAHSTDPSQSAQVQLKGQKRQVILATKDIDDGTDMMIAVDGTNGLIQITAWGGIIEMRKTGGLSLTAPDGTSLLLEDGAIHFGGTPVLGAGNPPSLGFMLGAGDSPGGSAALPMKLARGVAAGT